MQLRRYFHTSQSSGHTRSISGRGERGYAVKVIESCARSKQHAGSDYNRQHYNGGRKVRWLWPKEEQCMHSPKIEYFRGGNRSICAPKCIHTSLCVASHCQTSLTFLNYTDFPATCLHVLTFSLIHIFRPETSADAMDPRYSVP